MTAAELISLSPLVVTCLIWRSRPRRPRTKRPMPLESIAPSGARSVELNGTVSGLEQVPFTVLAVAGARVYHTNLTANDSQWSYSRWKGTLSFCRDVDTAHSITQGTSNMEKHWFRLADDETGRTVWIFKFPENFEYAIDRPFFHIFQGRVRHISLSSDFDRSEAWSFRHEDTASFSTTTTKHHYSGKKS